MKLVTKSIFLKANFLLHIIPEIKAKIKYGNCFLFRILTWRKLGIFRNIVNQKALNL
jgi:hypothetical protein